MSNDSIRLMTIQDVEQVMEVETDAFASPWTKEIFENELKVNHYANYIVYELEDKIIGYCGFWLIAGDAQITNIAIHSSHRGEKRGEELLEAAITLIKGMDGKRVSLEVRESNVVAQGLYRKFGMEKGGIRKNYYQDNAEDAWVMWVDF
ncbi:ribosomal protein S18-alanine N-acetyltransferase [Alkalicoccobacillus plakortidis]|uniref:[Ribosomal protein bS18]-alanine N-acetyltransferase n=1 Tax=Alkalicoccobacillus plakortidis TaxID=444060 RepID=A0ABT0XM79_9BACI|nr:ribosomal protein S18-alanine N-acetyltransferase [Alkalicoccobacillus plakortidis]MCM2677015.1 ribosomal protein S18-alanine N-acetyltransferase [Alkalicoccobacillus plakortidis]